MIPRGGRRDSSKVLAKWGACLIWEMLEKPLVHGRVLWCAGGMYGLTLSARREITKKEAGAYVSASKKVKGEILDRLVAKGGWSRASSCRQLGKVLRRRESARALLPTAAPTTNGYDTVKVLQQVWALAVQPCGKYSTATMGTTLASMKAHIGSGAFGGPGPLRPGITRPVAGIAGSDHRPVACTVQTVDVSGREGNVPLPADAPVHV